MSATKLNMRCHLATLIFIAQLFFSTSAGAATIELKDYNTELSVNGEMQAGDAERIISLVLASRVFDKVGQGVYQLQNISINSKGGDIGEALKIASFVRATYLNLSVRGGEKGTPSVCASACFFVYIAAYSRHANGVDIKVDWRLNFSQGLVGIHRPYYLVPQGGLASQARQDDVMRSVRSSLQLEGISQHLIDEMMAHPSNDVYWLTRRDIESIGEFKPSVEEELISKCGYKRWNLLTDTDLASTQRGRIVGQCQAQLWWKTYWPMGIVALERMRLGWRPWDAK